jgi:hypothetical protein
MGIAGATSLVARKMSRTQALSALHFAALTAHARASLAESTTALAGPGLI